MNGEFGIRNFVSFLSFLILNSKFLIQQIAQLRQQRSDLLLIALPDDVDLGVVGDGLQGDVGNALVDEALTQ